MWRNFCIRQVAEQNWSFRSEAARLSQPCKERPIYFLDPDSGSRTRDVSRGTQFYEKFWGQVWAASEEEKERCTQLLSTLAYQVIAVVMAMVIDGTFNHLISGTVLEAALDGLKDGKCCDSTGLVAEPLAKLSENSKDILLSLFNNRINSTNLDQDNDDVGGSWRHVPAFLIAKFPLAIKCEDWRPIAIIAVIQKLFLRCIVILLTPYLEVSGHLQYGAAKGKQAAEVIHLLRALIQISNLWCVSLVIFSLDCAKAFDKVKLSALFRFLVAKSVPIRLRFALMKEVSYKRKIKLRGPNFETDYIDQDSGLRQGSPEAALLFAALINYVLENLHTKWKNKGMGYWLHKSGNQYAWQELYDELLAANPDNCNGFDYCNV